jgi:hypothetical protein
MSKHGNCRTKSIQLADTPQHTEKALPDKHKTVAGRAKLIYSLWVRNVGHLSPSFIKKVLTNGKSNAIMRVEKKV